MATLLDADVKVWMITGDKQETAINIGISCKLIRNPDSLMICNGESYDGMRVNTMQCHGGVMVGRLVCVDLVWGECVCVLMVICAVFSTHLV